MDCCLPAAVACAQLEKINTILSAKRLNFKSYQKVFKKNQYINFIQEPKNSRCNYWLITGILKKNNLRNNLIKYLKLKGFSLRSSWRPLHTLKIFKQCPKDNMYYSMSVFNNAISFPSSPSISYK